MKKIILVMVIMMVVFVAVPAFAGVYGRIEEGKDIDEQNIYYTQIEIGYKFSLWQIKSQTFGGWNTWHENNNPFADTYTIGQRFSWRGFYTEINHYCTHRVVSTTHQSSYKLFEKYDTDPKALTIIKVGYEFEIK